MAKPKVYFRADANSSIGMGHLIRSSALASMLGETFEITFFTSSTPGDILDKFLDPSFKKVQLPVDEIAYFLESLSKENIIVLDGYNFDTAYQEKLKSTGAKIVYLDDLLSFEYSADVILNQAEGVSENDYHTKIKTRFCLGPKYALLRRPFLEAARNKNRNFEKITSAFLSFGGADADNITYKVLRTLVRFEQLENIHVLTSSVNKNISAWKAEFEKDARVHFHQDLNSEEVCELMKTCGLALSPSSSLSLELCAVGLVLITGTTADNQKGYYNALIKQSAALGVGEWKELSEEDLFNRLVGIMRYDKRDIDFFVRNQGEYIDGRSGERLLAVFKELAG